MGDLVSVGLIRQEFAGEALNISFAYHTLQAVKKEHLRLGIDENILKALCVVMIKQALQHYARSPAKGQDFGKRGFMLEM